MMHVETRKEREQGGLKEMREREMSVMRGVKLRRLRKWTRDLSFELPLAADT